MMENTTETIELIANRAYKCGFTIGEYMLHEPDLIEVTFDQARRRYEVGITNLFFSKPHDKKIIKYPSTWWDAVKERFLPFLKVHYTIYKIDYEIMFPEVSRKRIGGMKVIPVTYIDKTYKEK